MTSPTLGCQAYGDSTGILLAQLGSPDAPTKPALRKYLRQFLSDRRVIELFRPLWLSLLYGVILWRRPQRSARLYKRVWGKEGPPLVTITAAQTRGLEQRFEGQQIHVEFGMRYGSPSLESAIDRLKEKGCSRILLLPLYPQYAGATTASTYDGVFKKLLASRWVPTIKVVEPFYRDNGYLDSVAGIINRTLEGLETPPERLLLSFHGIPESYVAKGDPYCCMCNETAQLLRPRISFPTENILLTFQSQFGKAPWLTPYTDDTLEELASRGIKRVAVACPGFITDCLETIDEIGTESTEIFHKKGGETLIRISCLNDDPQWLDALYSLAKKELGSWIAAESNRCPKNQDCPIMLNQGKKGPLPRIPCNKWST